MLIPRQHYAGEDGLWLEVAGKVVLQHAASGRDIAPRAPVTHVSARAVDWYIRWRRERDGIAWRLPTRAEWHLIANGQDDRLYTQGDLPAVDQPARAMRFNSNQAISLSPWGSFTADQGPYGHHDCAASVAEFTQDSLAEDNRLRWYSGASWGDIDAARFRQPRRSFNR